MFEFEITAQDPSGARCGFFHTPHGGFSTPIFMPVGTVASVKAVAPDDLFAIDAEIILGNTYHLMLRPGSDTVAEMGGLHDFMAWPKSILTDSGGFQVFSLASLRKVENQGVEFRSHIDGTLYKLTPERALQIQEELGSDIAMALDVCPELPAKSGEVEHAMGLTTMWLDRAIAAKKRSDQALFGIVQGGVDQKLRQQHVEEICSRDLVGFAIGGLSVGESQEDMRRTCAATAPLMPREKPRYLMGVGTPSDLVCGIAAGVDMFDCVMPTRNARNGYLFTRAGTVRIKNARYKHDKSALDEGCSCYTCRTFTKGYLRHLFVSKELLAYRLLSIHNLTYYLDLVKMTRQAIMEQRFAQLKKEVCDLYDNSVVHA